MKRLDDETIEAIIREYQAGSPPLEIGKKYDIKNNSVTRILRKRGIERNQAADRVTPEQIAEMKELYEQGMSSEDIAIKLSIHSTTILRKLEALGIEKRDAGDYVRIHELNDPRYFQNIDTEEKAYFLGFMYGDGNVHQNKVMIKICLHNQDIDILHKFNKIIFKNSNCVTVGEKYSYLTISSKEMCYDLINHGCMPNKTFLIRLPNLDKSLMSHFMRGYADADGCISYSELHNRWRATITSNIEFTQQCANYIENNLQIKRTVYVDSKNKKTAQLEIFSKEHLLKYLSFLYKDSTIYLDRKYNLYLKYMQTIS
jgi:hypothetical protein